MFGYSHAQRPSDERLLEILIAAAGGDFTPYDHFLQGLTDKTYWEIKADYKQFVELLHETADLFNVNVAAICLVPNAFSKLSRCVVEGRVEWTASSGTVKRIGVE